MSCLLLVKIPLRSFYQLSRQRLISRVFAAQIIGKNLVEAVELAQFGAAHKGAVTPGFSFGDQLEGVG